MDLSVIICSRNRATMLGNALRSLARMTVSPEIRWELLVVDNDSTDATRQTVESFQASCTFPVRYLLEGQAGLSHARNRGLAEARGRLIAFTDDDVQVDARWVDNIYHSFARYDPACVGGKILPIWGKPKPEWLSTRLYGILALLDRGDQPVQLREPAIWGANFAAKAEALRTYGPFDTRLGRIPGKKYSCEETSLFAKLLTANEKLMYVPEIVVHHHVPPERMERRYFREWVYDQGELTGRLVGNSSRRNFCGFPLYFIRELGEDLGALAVATLLTRRECFHRQLNLIRTVGKFVGRLQWTVSAAGRGGADAA